MTRFELHEHVNVAVWTEVIPKDRAEEREPADMMTPAEVGDLLAWYRDSGLCHVASKVRLRGKALAGLDEAVQLG